MPRLSRKQSQEQTREKLLQAAGEVFAAIGYAGTSLDRIADKAGYSKGAVYSNFASKEEIFLELKHRRTLIEIEQIDTALASLTAQEDIGSQLRKVFAAPFEALMPEEVGNQWLLLGVELRLHARRNPDFEARYKAIEDRHRAALADWVTRLFLALDKTPPAHPEDIAALMVGLSFGLFLEHGGDDHRKIGEQIAVVLESLIATAPDRDK